MVTNANVDGADLGEVPRDDKGPNANPEDEDKPVDATHNSGCGTRERDKCRRLQCPQHHGRTGFRLLHPNARKPGMGSNKLFAHFRPNFAGLSTLGTAGQEFGLQPRLQISDVIGFLRDRLPSALGRIAFPAQLRRPQAECGEDCCNERWKHRGDKGTSGLIHKHPPP
ncbi:hypothetical protein GCM10007170_32680 [Arthrobacter liuii]|uniref:Uncharacterized protein n=1 Tax=Arthrobacter liuii TaxID=1476996 RepID=A0ABQ2AVE5_9MICC|nr:hypothetical protein GCM10007170_32680 [Arthrobacter liuii]